MGDSLYGIGTKTRKEGGLKTIPPQHIFDCRNYATCVDYFASLG